ncbi:MAG TPA: hypothetical protein VIJ59_02365, partial [Caulobacteraceae bacterium]
MRIALHSVFLAEKPATQTREVERAADLVAVLAPTDWTSARVEAWLDWAATLPGDYPRGETPAALVAPADPLLG